MEKKVLELFETIDYLIKIEWATKVGLLKYSIGIFIFLVFIYSLLQSIKISTDGYGFLYILILVEVVHFLIWFIKSLFFYKSDIKTIAFAIETTEKSKNHYIEIKKRFEELIKDKNIDNYVKVRELPSDVMFDDSKKAESFILQKGIGLLIWGKTFEGNQNDFHLANFKIKFTCQYLKKNKEEKIFISDISSTSKRKYWKVWMPQSDFDLTVVSENIFEISLFILGKCLSTVPKENYLIEAVSLFENLTEVLKEKKPDENFPNLRNVKEKTSAILLELYLILCCHFCGEKKDIPRSIYYGEKVVYSDENSFVAHQNLAICKWLDGDEKGARFHTKRAWRIKPGNPLTRLNRAFFYVYDKNFEQGIKEYKKVKYVGETNIIDVIEFIEKEFEKNNTNFGLLFSSGWLDMEYGDKKRGSKKLKDFIEKSRNIEEYNILMEEIEKNYKII